MNKTVGCFNPRIKNSYSVSVYVMAVHSLLMVESLSSISVKRPKMSEIRFILFVPLCDYNSDAPILKFDA